MKKKECAICVYSLLFMCKGCGLCDEDIARKPNLQSMTVKAGINILKIK